MRVKWVDTARGIAIIAVVIYHSALFLTAVEGGGPWLQLMNALETFRMPLFFFASGLFSAKILTQTFPELWRKRLVLFLYLYALWSIIRFVFFQFMPFVLPTSDASDWHELAYIFFWPTGGLWFIYALALFSVFVWLFRSQPAWLPVGIAAIVSLFFSSGFVPIENTSIQKMGAYLVFFVAAIYLRDWTVRLTSRRHPWLTAAFLFAYPGLVFLLSRADAVKTVPGAKLFLCAFGVAFGVALAALITQWRAFDWVAYLGRTTLPIYLVHYLPVAALAVVLVPIEVGDVWQLLGTPVVAGASILISLAVHQLLTPIRGVFDVPWKTKTPPLAVR